MSTLMVMIGPIRERGVPADERQSGRSTGSVVNGRVFR